MRPWLLALILALTTAGVVAALVTSEESGTGAENVGDDGQAEISAPKTCEVSRMREKSRPFAFQ